MLNIQRKEMINTLENLKVLFVNLIIMGGITLADIEVYLKIFVLVITLGFTLWKWYTEYQKHKLKK